MRQGTSRKGGGVSVGLVLAALLCCGAAWAGQVNAVGLEQGATGTRAEIQLQGAGQYRTLSLTAPHRLVVDLPDSQAARGMRLPAPAGVVTSVRTGQPVPGTLRIVFELAAPVAALPLRMEPSRDGARLLIEWPGDGAPSMTAAAPAVVPAAATTPSAAASADSRAEAARATALLTAQVTEALSRPPTPAPAAPPTVPAPVAAASAQAILEGRSPGMAAAGAAPAPGPAVAATQTPPVASAPPQANPVAAAAPVPVAPRPSISAAGMRPLIVAIDAGHGGQDPGAIGPTGKREKDVTLAMARELARQINATPGLKAFLVRDSDVFIPLPMRAQRARAAKADIFVSLHADAA